MEIKGKQMENNQHKMEIKGNHEENLNETEIAGHKWESTRNQNRTAIQGNQKESKRNQKHMAIKEKQMETTKIKWKATGIKRT